MTIDDRSKANIATLRPRAQPWMVALYVAANEYAAQHNLTVKIISGNRTWAEQDALYAKGRTSGGSIVTNARGGQSNHNYQIAIDLGLFRGGVYLDESEHYKALGAIGKKLGLAWGGDWRSIQDEPHFEIPVGKSVSQLRAIVNSAGWSAIDALIPEYKPATPAPKPTPLAPETVEVWYDDLGDGKPPVKFDIPAVLKDGSTWVLGSSFCDYFGGAFTPPAEWAAKISLHGAEKSLGSIRTAEGAFVKFSEVNEVLGLPYSFDGKLKPKRLTIHRDAPEQDQ